MRVLKGTAGREQKGENGNLWEILQGCNVKSSLSTTNGPAGSVLALRKGSRSATRRLLVQVCWDLLAHPSKALVPQPPPCCRQAAGSLFYEHPKSIRNHKTTLHCRRPIVKDAKAGVRPDPPPTARPTRKSTLWEAGLGICVLSARLC